MRLLQTVLPDNFNLYLFGDAHRGTIAHHEDGFKEMVQTILDDPIGYAIDHGDMIEAITVDDKRYDPDTCKTPVLAQITAALECRQDLAISGKLVGVLTGNHEQKLWRFGSITERIAIELGVPYMGRTGIFSYYDKKGRLMFKHYAAHGARRVSSTADDPIRRDANMKISLKRILSPMAGDCALMSMGHTHRLLVVNPNHVLYLTSTQDKIKQNYYKTHQTDAFIHPDHRWYVNTGSFFCSQVIGADTYSESFQYPPLELGYARVEVRDRQIVDVVRVFL